MMFFRNSRNCPNLLKCRGQEIVHNSDLRFTGAVTEMNILQWWGWFNLSENAHSIFKLIWLPSDLKASFSSSKSKYSNYRQ